uniref:CXXC repeat containing interactor of PDZ3 domain n=1 Tax=Myotis myotis TaxID=51298 RepID=A0A7J7U481_MYOMY|nr:CXXC repeat containing interactor of PDZ3 domain [Myotis myotis]
MVCEKCEKKLGTVITPDTWKDGARNTTGIFPFRTQKLNPILSVNNVLT